jgi:hypothetical protein
VLKARTALHALDHALRDRAEEPEAAAVLRDAERLRASEHEFTEIRVLNALRSGQLEIDSELQADLERILGGDGDAPATRVDAGPEATDAEVQAAATAQLGRWRRLGDHPMSSRGLVDAANAAARSCEGILIGLAGAAKPDDF